MTNKVEENTFEAHYAKLEKVFDYKQAGDKEIAFFLIAANALTEAKQEKSTPPMG